MTPGRISLFAAVLTLAGCCLTVVSGLDMNDAGVGTASSSGNITGTTGGAPSTTGGSAIGGTSTGGGGCHSSVSVSGTVTTLAGADAGVVLGVDGILEAAATEVVFANVPGVAVDSSGNVYVSDDGHAQIDRIDCAGEIWLSPLPAG